ncbi:hypothetical protein [Nocardioides sp. zg-DK7169]|uniref:hypothetical protein n=1 Tax=Nocardioides sp. zg-DK7169 TaxID=2736600 RepID=UPI001556BCD0|nr:hypothetical protein [Nocardioides sp. zg-DK7169]NPC96613.1 hypothetical protein [Nocardioides sp. zg-DK7169]
MGIELMKIVVHRHGRLPGNAYKVLMAMAQTALDRPVDGKPARLYFGGWEPLARALGHEVPLEDKSDPGVTARRDQLQEYVRRAVSQLAREGVFERLVEHPRHGDRQVYKLTVSALGSAPLEQGGSSPTEVVGLSPTETGVQQPPTNRGSSPPETGGPRKDLGATEDLLPEHTTPPPLVPLGVAPDPEPTEQIDPYIHSFESGIGAQRCDLCGKPTGHAWHLAAAGISERAAS